VVKIRQCFNGTERPFQSWKVGSMDFFICSRLAWVCLNEWYCVRFKIFSLDGFLCVWLGRCLCYNTDTTLILIIILIVKWIFLYRLEWIYYFWNHLWCVFIRFLKCELNFYSIFKMFCVCAIFEIFSNLYIFELQLYLID
jgi:hypothetical protein